MKSKRVKSDTKVIIALSILLIMAALFSLSKPKNNVCTSFSDYYGDRDNNKNCYFNPDANLNVTQIIKRWGYPTEEHVVITDDGYMLTLFRIPHGLNSTTTQPREPVLLQHGAVLNSASFVNRGNKSLAFILVDAGYDVWLGNFRGTIYSKRHMYLDSKDKEFWDFDTYELGYYDTSAKIDLIYRRTGQKVIYIGHSLGTTTAYIHGVTSPVLAKKKVKIIVSLAPTLYVKNWQSVTRYFFSAWKLAKPLILALTNGEIYLRGKPESALRESLCTTYPFQMHICQFLNMIVTGFNYEQSDPETLPITIMQNADAVSYRTLTHNMQLVEKGNLDYFDYGVELNTLRYGSPYPPQYNLSLLQIPTYLIRAQNDLLITKPDVEHIHRNLPKEANAYDIFTIDHESFNHEDFITARDVVPLLYDHIVLFLKKL
ncbi:hypothetical protein FQA39_LY14473 [Lamprigera yunnana]|nr:hypothetical protein FQA39_LY14473 [Lamprigera yunnana]